MIGIPWGCGCIAVLRKGLKLHFFFLGRRVFPRYFLTPLVWSFDVNRNSFFFEELEKLPIETAAEC